MRSLACIVASLSQEDLAAKLGLKLPQIQRYEETEYQIQWRVVRALLRLRM